MEAGGNQKLALQANWIHPVNTERWLKSISIGRTLNVCCGMSKVGNVRIDTDPNSNRTQEGDLFKLKELFSPLSFDTGICDPPFDYFVTGDNRFRWIQSLADLCRKRVVISVKGIALKINKDNWRRSLWYAEDEKMFLRLYWVFDRLNGILEV